jgi:hypothetical protein
MLKNAISIKKSYRRDIAATVESLLKSAAAGPIPDADPYTEHAKKHLIPA